MAMLDKNKNKNKKRNTKQKPKNLLSSTLLAAAQWQVCSSKLLFQTCPAARRPEQYLQIPSPAHPSRLPISKKTSPNQKHMRFLLPYLTRRLMPVCSNFQIRLKPTTDRRLLTRSQLFDFAVVKPLLLFFSFIFRTSHLPTISLLLYLLFLERVTCKFFYCMQVFFFSSCYQSFLISIFTIFRKVHLQVFYYMQAFYSYQFFSQLFSYICTAVHFPVMIPSHRISISCCFNFNDL